MKIKVWVLSTCIPDENSPVFPSVFADFSAAEAYAEERLKEEWASRAPCDDEGEPLPYPGDWKKANDHLSAESPEWGQWEMTTHEIEVALPHIAIIVEGGIVQSLVTVDVGAVGQTYDMIDYDTDGADEAELYGIPQEDGSISAAYVTCGSVSLATINLAGIKPFSAFDDEEEVAA